MSRFLQQNFRKTKQLGISRIIVTVMRYIQFFFLHLIFNKVVIQNRCCDNCYLFGIVW